MSGKNSKSTSKPVRRVSAKLAQNAATLSFASLVQAFFDAQSWQLQWPEPGVFAKADVEGEHGRWELVVNVREPERQILVLSLCPILIPPKHVQAIGEFASRANTGLVVGNFELDWDDGELRYKTGLDVGDAEPSIALLAPIFAANVTMMDHYLPGVMAVMAGADPAQAVDNCEVEGLFDGQE